MINLNLPDKVGAGNYFGMPIQSEAFCLDIYDEVCSILIKLTLFCGHAASTAGIKASHGMHCGVWPEPTAFSQPAHQAQHGPHQFLGSLFLRAECRIVSDSSSILWHFLACVFFAGPKPWQVTAPDLSCVLHGTAWLAAGFLD